MLLFIYFLTSWFRCDQPSCLHKSLTLSQTIPKINMNSFIISLFILSICILYSSYAEDAENNKAKLRGNGKSGKKGRKNKNGGESPEKIAIRTWANSLTENDYSVDYWNEKFKSTTASDFFNGYAMKLSNIFKDVKAKVNFVLVGACDGTGDKTIKNIYLPNDHWRGVFVEPMSINVRDLIQFMAAKNIAHRSMIIRAAATSKCVNSTIVVERPLYEEKTLAENKTIPVSAIFIFHTSSRYSFQQLFDFFHFISCFSHLTLTLPFVCVKTNPLLS